MIDPTTTIGGPNGEQPRDPVSSWLDRIHRNREIVQYYIRAWQGSTRQTLPRIESYWPNVAPDMQADLLWNLIPLDLRFQKLRGIRLSSQAEYARRFPGHDPVIATIFREIQRSIEEPHQADLAQDSTRRCDRDRDQDPGPDNPDSLLKSTQVDPQSQDELLDHNLTAADPVSPIADRSSLEMIRSHKSDSTIPYQRDRPMAGTDPLAEPGPGMRIPEADRFLILSYFASGGLGDIYLAYDRQVNRRVALKRIRSRYEARPQSQKRFLREAILTGCLDHPGVPAIYAHSRDLQGRLYYAMKFVDGETFDQPIKSFHQLAQDPSKGQEAKKRLRELVECVLSITQTIRYAHSRGILHRDLKPKNIKVERFGQVFVLDWGLAKLVRPELNPSTQQSREEEPWLTEEPGLELASLASSPGAVVGSASHSSPEAAQGQIDLIDERSDLFGIGAILYQVLTNQPPFRGAGIEEVISQACLNRHLPAHEVRPEMPGALAAIASKAMATRPEQRYQTAEELAEDLHRWLADDPIAIYRDPWPDRLSRWSRRHRTTVVSIAVSTVMALILAVVIAVGNTIFARQLDQRDVELSQAENRARLTGQIGRDLLNQAMVVVDDLFNVGRAFDERLHLAQISVNTLRKYVLIFSDDFNSRQLLVESLQDLALLENFSGQRRQAIRHTQEAITVQKELDQRNPRVNSNSNQLTMISLTMSLASYQAQAYLLEESEQSYRHAQELIRNHRPDDLDFSRARVLSGLAHLKVYRGDPKGAIGLSRESLQIQAKSFLKENPEKHPELIYQWIITQSLLAEALLESGAFTESRAVFETCLGRIEEMQKADSKNPDFQSALLAMKGRRLLAQAIIRGEDHDDGSVQTLLDDNLNRFAELLAEFPESYGLRLSQIRMLADRAEWQQQSGTHASAWTDLNLAHDLADDLLQVGKNNVDFWMVKAKLLILKLETIASSPATISSDEKLEESLAQELDSTLSQAEEFTSEQSRPDCLRRLRQRANRP